MKEPGVAIPKGTLFAIATTYVTYIIYGIVVGFTYTTQASGITEEYSIWHNDTITVDDELAVGFCYGAENL